jgi:hypothetical protein
MDIQVLREDQSREFANTQQRYQAYVDARGEMQKFKGSMTFGPVKGTEYLMRQYYDRNGVRKVASLGARSPETEAAKLKFDAEKAEVEQRLASVREAIERQARINRAVGLGRVPRLNARILRRIDADGLADNGIRLIGTNCIFAYEAAANVRVTPDLTTTEDVDILMDARAKMRIAAEEIGQANTLLGILQKVDRSFKRTPRTFQAANKDGFLVDLVKPMPRRPDRAEALSITNDPGDLVAAEIDGLFWHVNSPAFRALAIDIDGLPVPIVAPDPVAFAVHKLWLSERPDRNPLKKARDARQAEVIAKIVTDHLPQLEFDPDRLLQFPREVVDKAAYLFSQPNSAPSLVW